MRTKFALIALLAVAAALPAAQQPAAAPAAPADFQAQIAHPGKPAVPFIENDYAAARAEAERRNVPLFIDMWAPW